MEPLSTLQTQNNDLQSQLALTTEQLSTLQTQNDDLLSELMKLHSIIEMTKERCSTRVYSLQKYLEAEQSRVKDAEIEAALVLKVEQSCAKAAEEEAAFVLESSKKKEYTSSHSREWPMVENGRKLLGWYITAREWQWNK